MLRALRAARCCCAAVRRERWRVVNPCQPPVALAAFADRGANAASANANAAHAL